MQEAWSYRWMFDLLTYLFFHIVERGLLRLKRYVLADVHRSYILFWCLSSRCSQWWGHPPPQRSILPLQNLVCAYSGVGGPSHQICHIPTFVGIPTDLPPAECRGWLPYIGVPEVGVLLCTAPQSLNLGRWSALLSDSIDAKSKRILPDA
jgi:hypothetical protein